MVATRLCYTSGLPSHRPLSAMKITDLEALNGIIWTRQTTWPPTIDVQVEDRSIEIRPGVYQVRLGDTLAPR
jgi:hypothetical protein